MNHFFIAPKEDHVLEWNILRDLTTQSSGITRSPAKVSKTLNIKKDTPSPQKKHEGQSQNPDFRDNESLESFSEDKRLYYNINNEYLIRVNDLFQIPQPCSINSIPYLLEVDDIIKEVHINDEEPKKNAEKGPKKVLSKPVKDIIKRSKDTMWQNSEKASMDSADKLKSDTYV